MYSSQSRSSNKDAAFNAQPFPVLCSCLTLPVGVLADDLRGRAGVYGNAGSETITRNAEKYREYIYNSLSLKAQILVSSSFNSTGINKCYWKTRSNSPKHLLLFKITEKLSNLHVDSQWCVCRAVWSCLTQAASDTSCLPEVQPAQG